MKICLLFVLMNCFHVIQAQNAIIASGGAASGTGGSVSYSAGQLVNSTITGSTHSFVQGVQQPYEISVVTGTGEDQELSDIITVFPNPTSDYLILRLALPDVDNQVFQISDINGTLLERRPIIDNDTHISMTAYMAGVYFLKIVQGDREVKIFKIIKNQ